MLDPDQAHLDASAPNFSPGPLSPRAITMASNEGIKEEKPSAQLGPRMLCSLMHSQ